MSSSLSLSHSLSTLLLPRQASPCSDVDLLRCRASSVAVLSLTLCRPFSFPRQAPCSDVGPPLPSSSPSLRFLVAAPHSPLAVALRRNSSLSWRHYSLLLPLPLVWLGHGPSLSSASRPWPLRCILSLHSAASHHLSARIKVALAVSPPLLQLKLVTRSSICAGAHPSLLHQCRGTDLEFSTFSFLATIWFSRNLVWSQAMIFWGWVRARSSLVCAKFGNVLFCFCGDQSDFLSCVGLCSLCSSQVLGRALRSRSQVASSVTPTPCTSRPKSPLSSL